MNPETTGWMAIAAILSVLSTKGIDALIKWRQSVSQIGETERLAQNTTLTKGYELVIARLDANAEVMKLEIKELKADIDVLEAKADKSQLEHIDCLKNQERLKFQVEVLSGELAQLKKH